MQGRYALACLNTAEPGNGYGRKPTVTYCMPQTVGHVRLDTLE